MIFDSITIRALTATDANAFKCLRLLAIESSPTTIWPTHEEESARSLEEVEARIQTTATQIVFGAFSGPNLIGIAGLRRDSLLQVGHKGVVWGVLVDQSQRGRGLARKLLEAVVVHARNSWALVQLNLTVNTENVAAKNLYESMGFVIFGVEPRAMRVGTQFFDEQHMTLTL